MLKRHDIALGLLLATAFWAALMFLNSDTSAYHQVCETNQYTGKESCAPHNIPYVFVWYVGHWFDIASAVITAFATFAIALFTLHLRNANRAQLTHYRQVERAHVSLLRTEGEWRRDDNGLIVGLRVAVVWKNSGTTPATPITAMIGAHWVPKVEDFVFGQQTGNERQVPFVLGAGSEQQSGTLEIAPVHISANLERRGHQFVWGWVRYRDIFPGTPEHVAEFCLELTLTGHLRPPPAPAPSIGLAVYGEHNRYYDERK